jgi:hypothetical protein
MVRIPYGLDTYSKMVLAIALLRQTDILLQALNGYIGFCQQAIVIIKP